ncbi:MAG: alpha/beta hydrolase [Chthoniobacteraceae bacterium]
MKSLALLLALAVVAHAETRTETYKTIGDVKLDLIIQLPDGWKAEDKRPAIVFFFGGGWTGGSTGQFENQARYLASRGMVAMCADYRVASRHRVKAASCVADAKSAMRWVRANAAKLGIDPDRLAAGGGSAGGHLAGAVATLPGLDDPADDKSVNCVPNALVLFNPALVLAPADGADLSGFLQKVTAERFGCEPTEISPLHHVKAGAPPTIIFHGKADTTVPYSSVELFTARMTKAGNRCELVGADGQAHGYFNFRAGKTEFAYATLTAADKFLASLGWLKGEPTVEKFFTANPPAAFKK